MFQSQARRRNNRERWEEAKRCAQNAAKIPKCSFLDARLRQSFEEAIIAHNTLHKQQNDPDPLARVSKYVTESLNLLTELQNEMPKRSFPHVERARNKFISECHSSQVERPEDSPPLTSVPTVRLKLKRLWHVYFGIASDDQKQCLSKPQFVRFHNDTVTALTNGTGWRKTCLPEWIKIWPEWKNPAGRDAHHDEDGSDAVPMDDDILARALDVNWDCCEAGQNASKDSGVVVEDEPFTFTVFSHFMTTLAMRWIADDKFLSVDSTVPYEEYLIEMHGRLVLTKYRYDVEQKFDMTVFIQFDEECTGYISFKNLQKMSQKLVKTKLLPEESAPLEEELTNMINVTCIDINSKPVYGCSQVWFKHVSGEASTALAAFENWREYARRVPKPLSTTETGLDEQKAFGKERQTGDTDREMISNQHESTKPGRASSKRAANRMTVAPAVLQHAKYSTVKHSQFAKLQLQGQNDAKRAPQRHLDSVRHIQISSGEALRDNMLLSRLFSRASQRQNKTARPQSGHWGYAVPKNIPNKQRKRPVSTSHLGRENMVTTSWGVPQLCKEHYTVSFNVRSPDLWQQSAGRVSPLISDSGADGGADGKDRSTQIESTISCSTQINRSRSRRSSVDTESDKFTKTMLRWQGPSRLRLRPKAEEQTLGHSGEMVHLSSSAVSLNKSSGQFRSERIARELENSSADWFKVASNSSWKHTTLAGSLAKSAPGHPTRMYRPPASAPAVSRPRSHGTTSLKLPRIVFDGHVPK